MVQRFASRRRWATDRPTTLAGIAANADLVRYLSGERISIELSKLLAADRPSIRLRLLADSRLLERIAPELARQRGVAQNKVPGEDLWDHTVRTVDAARVDRPVVRLAALSTTSASRRHTPTAISRARRRRGRCPAGLLDQLRSPRPVREQSSTWSAATCSATACLVRHRSAPVHRADRVDASTTCSRCARRTTSAAACRPLPESSTCCANAWRATWPPSRPRPRPAPDRRQDLIEDSACARARCSAGPGRARRAGDRRSKLNDRATCCCARSAKSRTSREPPVIELILQAERSLSVGELEKAERLYARPPRPIRGIPLRSSDWPGSRSTGETIAVPIRSRGGRSRSTRRTQPRSDWPIGSMRSCATGAKSRRWSRRRHNQSRHPKPRRAHRPRRLQCPHRPRPLQRGRRLQRPCRPHPSKGAAAARGQAGGRPAPAPSLAPRPHSPPALTVSSGA